MNIAEILKDEPKGTKLYSIPWGKCTLEEVDTSLPLLPITVRNCLDDLQKRYTKKGTYHPSLDECLLFPSKDMRDWRKFVWKKGAILVSNDGETVVMFFEWANGAYTEFLGAKFPVKKEEGKSTFNTCDFQSCCQSYNIEPCVNPTTGEFTVKTVRITVGNSEPNDTNKPIEPKYSFKSEPKYRPFKDAEEYWKEMKNHQPFGYIIDKTTKLFSNIGMLDNRGILTLCTQYSCSLKESFNRYTFADGTPFGIKEGADD